MDFDLTRGEKYHKSVQILPGSTHWGGISMMRHRGRLCYSALALLFAITASSAIADDVPNLTTHVEKINSAGDANERKKACRALFSDDPREVLTQLLQSPDDGIALQAAWERVRLTIPVDEKSSDNSRTGIPVNRAALNKFAGFVEGRLRIEIPQWWLDVLSETGAYDRSELANSTHKHDATFRTASTEWIAPENYDVIERNGKFILSSPEEKLPIPTELIKEAGGENAILAVACVSTMSECIIAFPGIAAGEYKLSSVDRKTKKTNWSSNIFGSAPVGGGSTGIGPPHPVTLVTDKERIIVFGADASSLYIEGVSLINGNSLFRFSTSY